MRGGGGGDASRARRASRPSTAAACRLEIEQLLRDKSEGAHKTLFAALQRECRFLNVEFLELKPMLPQAIALLQPHQKLFDDVLAEYSNARRSFVLSERLRAALARAGADAHRPSRQLSRSAQEDRAALVRSTEVSEIRLAGRTLCTR